MIRVLEPLIQRWPLAGRWIRFNLVGGIGFGVQFVLLALLHHLMGVDYLWATAVAIEITIIHNFLWHELWTWGVRRSGGGWAAFGRLFRYNTTTGAFSLANQLILMTLLVGGLGLPVLPANLLAVGAGSLVNFLIAHFWIFGPWTRPRVPASGE